MCEEVKAFFEKWLLRASHTRVMFGGKANWVKLLWGSSAGTRSAVGRGEKNAPHTGEVCGVRGKCAERVAPRGIEPLFTL